MPGPICTWERDYDVNDGTSCKMPSQTPGPMVRRSPNIWERGEAVLEAYEKARLLAPAAVVKKTGYELGQLLKGLLPGLLQTLIILAATTALGAVAGGVIGFFFGGVWAAPGAVIGGEIGLDIGTAVLSWLGLAFLAAVIVQGFGELWAILSAGIKRAWAAPESPEKQYPHEIDGAANELADAVGIFVLLILKGIVAWVFGKAGIRATKGALAAGRAVSTGGSDVAAAEAVAALAKQLRASKLGSGFADWVEQNWSRLKDDSRLRFRERPSADGGSGARTAGTSEQAPEKLSSGAGPSVPKVLTKSDLADWYRKQGDYFKVPKNLENHLEGTDYTRPVTLRELPEGTKVIQYVRTDGEPGMYFARPGTPMGKLGIYEPPPRVLRQFIVQKPIEAVESTAAGLDKDLAPGVGGTGGGQQLIFPKGWEDSVVPSL
jgi:hypothetical protein